MEQYLICRRTIMTARRKRESEGGAILRWIFMNRSVEINLCCCIGCHVIYSRYARSVTALHGFCGKKTRTHLRSHSISRNRVFANPPRSSWRDGKQTNFHPLKKIIKNPFFHRIKASCLESALCLRGTVKKCHPVK